MIELHMYLETHDGKEEALEALYREEYISGIEGQDGFQRTVLLKKQDAPREYEVDIAFDSEEQRLKWVESGEHAAVWPKMAALCRQVSSCGFDTIA